MKKYGFTGEIKEFCGRTLRQIRALRSFGSIQKGQVGGWIESEKNLSHDGDCWVYENAWVSGNAMVYGNAQVYENAWVSGNAQVYGYAMVYGNAMVSGNALVSGKSKIYGYSRINHEVIDLEVEGIFRNDYLISYSGVSKEGVHFIQVGCQVHSLETWKDETKRNEIVRSNDFNKSLIPEFLKILNEIETKYCSTSSNKDLLRKISKNVEEMNVQVTEDLKQNTITLTSSLVPEKKENVETLFESLSTEDKIKTLKSLITKL